jgi:hypothetical protein
MEFFRDAVDMLETIAAALGAGLQAWGELKNGEKRKAITREFINRRLMRKNRMNILSSSMNLIMSGGGERPPPVHKNVLP